MKIFFFESNAADQAEINKLASADTGLASAELLFSEQALSAETAGQAADADIISVFIHSTVDAQVIGVLAKTKLIVTRSTGYDHIDLAAAAAKNIVVANVPAYGARTVAEYTMGLIFGLARKIFAAMYQVKSAHSFDISHFEGFDLLGKTLGIVGTGRIGLNVARLARGMGMEVVATDAHPNMEQAQEIGFEYMTLDELLPRCDILTLHVPALPGTEHLINKTNIMLLKPGALLVNTSRGEVVETEAILQALDAKILAGVALDVIEDERDLLGEAALILHPKTTERVEQYKVLLADHMLIDRPEVFVTPHIAFFSAEARHEILLTSIEDISAFMQGAPKNTIHS